MQNMNILLFGLGKNAQKCIRDYGTEFGNSGIRIVGFVDNDISKAGTSFMGLNCMVPDAVRSIHFDEIIITPENKEVCDAIFKQLLRDYNIPINKIFMADRLFELKQLGVSEIREREKISRDNRVYDCFMFNNEFDILDIRLDMLSDYVDRFVLVEMPYTLRGEKKPCYFEINMDRYKEYSDRIVYVKATDPPSYKGYGDWGLEFYQRNSIERGLIDCEKDDLIIISDVDEIVNPDILELVRKNEKNGRQDILTRLLERKAVVCEMEYYYYFFNLKFKHKWGGSTLVRYKNMLKPQEHRDLIQKACYVPNGGWHLSYFGDADFISQKINSIVDSVEVSSETIQDSLINGKDLYGRSGELYDMEFVDKGEVGIKNIDKYIEKYPQYYHSL